MAKIDVQVAAGRFYLETPTELEAAVVGIIVRMIDDMQALTNLMESGSIEISIKKQKDA